MSRRWMWGLLLSAPLLAPCPARAAGMEADMVAGWRRDRLDWSIAASGVNVRSELTWRDLDSFQIGGRVQAGSGPVRLKVEGAYGWIRSGSNQDSDYGADNRAQEFSRSYSDAGFGHVYDLSAALGYRLDGGASPGPGRGPRIAFTPWVGVSYHVQALRMRDGYQAVSGVDPITGSAAHPTGPIAGLDSSYRARWQGPWIGLGVEAAVAERRSLTAAFTYHWAHYRGEADWNLRTDLAHPLSFLHTADGHGITAMVQGNAAVGRNWRLTLRFSYQNWRTDAGTHTAFARNGGRSEARLNAVNWRSYTAGLAAVYRF